MTDRLTILTTTAAKALATKVWRRDRGVWSKTSFNAGKYFRHREIEIDGIHDLADRLTEISASPADFVIRGGLKPDKVAEAAHNPIRRLLDRGKDGADPVFDPCPRHWIMIDADKVEMPIGFDLGDDPAACIEWYVGEHLPEPFHDVTCFWQLSASAGVEDELLSAHIWYWLDRPISDGDLKAFFEIEAPTADRSLFNAVQIHYVAAPVFDNADDPILVRQGLMERETDTVNLPGIDRDELQIQSVQIRKAGGIVFTGKTFDDRIKLIGDGPGLRGFHAPIRDSIMVWARTSATGIAEIEALKVRIREAIRSAPKRSGRDVAIYLTDHYLDGSIQGAIRRVSAPFLADASQVETADTLPLDEAETRLTAEISTFLTETAVGEAPVHAIAAEIGLGKTRAILKALADIDLVRVHYYIPTHRLGQEVADRFEGGARIWRGRSRQDADGKAETDDQGLPMCFDDVRDKADAFERAGVSVSEHFCPTCPHLGACGWSRQKEDKGPGLVIMPVQYAFEESAGRADIQIFDESFWQTASRDGSVSLSALSIPQTVPARKALIFGNNDMDAGADLNVERAKLRRAFEAVGEGNIPTVTQSKAEGITVESARRAKAIEHQRADSVVSALKPSMSVAELERTWAHFPHRDARRWARVWQMIEDQIDLGRDRLHGFRRYVVEDEDGDPKDLLHAYWSRDLKAPDKPTLVLDATVDEEILRRFLPDLDTITRIRVAAAHAKVTQITDRVVAKGMVAPNDEDPRVSEDENKRRRKNIQRLGRIAEVLGAGSKAGLITYKTTEDELQVPGNVQTGHFNAIRGLDVYKDVDVLFVAGRPQPSEAEVERIAEGIFYKDLRQIESGIPRYGRTKRSVGEGFVEADMHPDPLVEAIRYQICEAEVIQAIGRARPIRRTAESPVEIVILTSVPVGIKVNVTTTWNDLVPDRFEVMAARGVVLEAGGDMVKAYPDLFKNAQAGRDAKRSNSVESPYVDTSIGKSHAVIRYQPAGAKQKFRRAAYRPDLVPDIRQWLESRLGVEIKLIVHETDVRDAWGETKAEFEVQTYLAEADPAPDSPKPGETVVHMDLETPDRLKAEVYYINFRDRIVQTRVAVLSKRQEINSLDDIGSEAIAGLKAYLAAPAATPAM